MTESENENVFTCYVEGCGDHELKGSYDQPYGWCQCCEEFTICDKRDAEHNASMLYCDDHCGYSVCIKCGTEAFKELAEKNGEIVMEGEEHCICPKCKHDHGLLSELQWPNIIEEKKFICSVNGYHKDTSEYGMHTHNMPYGWCDCCCEFAICGKGDAEHEASLLYWEECRAHHSGGYSVCIKCATKAFKELAEKNGDVFVYGKDHCICPVCEHDFGLLVDLQH